MARLRFLATLRPSPRFESTLSIILWVSVNIPLLSCALCAFMLSFYTLLSDTIKPKRSKGARGCIFSKNRVG